MKLDFLNIMNRKATPDEVAEQIAALEAKQQECEKARDAAKALCKEVRGKIMCGERVAPDAARNADKAYDEAVLDLEVVAETIEELKQKLAVAIETNRQDESKRLLDMRARLDNEREKAMRELAKAKGRLMGLAFGIYGHPAVTRRSLEESRSFTFTASDPFYLEFDIEYKKAVSDLKHPTFAEIDEDFQRKSNWLSSFNSDEEFARVLKRYRDKYAVEVREAQPVEA